MSNCKGCRHLGDYSGGNWSTELCNHPGAPNKERYGHFLKGRSSNNTLQETPEWCPKGKADDSAKIHAFKKLLYEYEVACSMRDSADHTDRAEAEHANVARIEQELIAMVIHD